MSTVGEVGKMSEEDAAKMEAAVREAKIFLEVEEELRRSQKIFPKPMNSTHEGWAVMYEEVDEMWDEVKANNPAMARKEAIQVAAMAIRFIVELPNLRTP